VIANTLPSESGELSEELRWSAWMPLNAAHLLALQQLPEAPEIFRIRTE
jgi:hypothetical protein